MIGPRSVAVVAWSLCLHVFCLLAHVITIQKTSRHTETRKKIPRYTLLTAAERIKEQKTRWREKEGRRQKSRMPEKEPGRSSVASGPMGSWKVGGGVKALPSFQVVGRLWAACPQKACLSEFCTMILGTQVVQIYLRAL